MHISTKLKIHLHMINDGYTDVDQLILEKLMPQLSCYSCGYSDFNVHPTRENMDVLLNMVHDELGIEIVKKYCEEKGILNITSDYDLYIEEINCSDTLIDSLELTLMYKVDKYVDIIKTNITKFAESIEHTPSRNSVRKVGLGLRPDDISIRDNKLTMRFNKDLLLTSPDFEYLEKMRHHKFFRGCKISHFNEMHIELSHHITEDISNESE